MRSRGASKGKQAEPSVSLRALTTGDISACILLDISQSAGGDILWDKRVGHTLGPHRSRARKLAFNRISLRIFAFGLGARLIGTAPGRYNRVQAMSLRLGA